MSKREALRSCGANSSGFAGTTTSAVTCGGLAVSLLDSQALSATAAPAPGSSSKLLAAPRAQWAPESPDPAQDTPTDRAPSAAAHPAASSRDRGLVCGVRGAQPLLGAQPPLRPPPCTPTGCLQLFPELPGSKGLSISAPQ